MTVRELIEELKKLPQDAVMYSDVIGKTIGGKIVINHKQTEAEKEMLERMREEDDERESHRGEITCFADRW